MCVYFTIILVLISKVLDKFMSLLYNLEPSIFKSNYLHYACYMGSIIPGEI